MPRMKSNEPGANHRADGGDAADSSSPDGEGYSSIPSVVIRIDNGEGCRQNHGAAASL